MLRCLAPLLRYQASVPRTFAQLPGLCGRHPCAQPCFDPCSQLVCARAREVEPPTAFRRNGPSAAWCPAGTHWGDPISGVRPDQSANSCCACWCAVLRRTRRRGKSRPCVCWVPSHKCFGIWEYCEIFWNIWNILEYVRLLVNILEYLVIFGICWNIANICECLGIFGNTWKDRKQPGSDRSRGTDQMKQVCSCTSKT